MTMKAKLIIVGILLGLALAMAMATGTAPAAGRYQITAVYVSDINRIITARVDTATGEIQFYSGTPQAMMTAGR